MLRPTILMLLSIFACAPVPGPTPDAASAVTPAGEATPPGSLLRARAVALGSWVLGRHATPRDGLLLDARPPSGVAAVRYSLTNESGGAVREMLLGGVDAGLPALFDAVEPGVYTACARFEQPGAAGDERCETFTVEVGGARLIALDA